MLSIHRSLTPAVSALMMAAPVLVVLVSAARVHGEPVVGQVESRTKPGAPRGTIIVFAEPLDGAVPARPATAKLEQKEKTFSPLVLAVPVGSSVEFPNLDPIFHNVFSLSTPEPFDLG